ncbi:MAG: hypothetical protein KGL39_40605 [Patescibacteria group bacterium]|nr:hypothetical protein [Patescibacteria group bacterium]
MSTQYQKAKSPGKRIEVKGEKLKDIVLRTMSVLSDIVGATLGPGGMPVLLERQENLPALVTKDGVTVMRSLGFEDSVQHCILEAARDAAVRTAAEAGDGTTTATVLAEAVVRRTLQYCEKHPQTSPQRVCRILERAFADVIEPTLVKASIRPPWDAKAEAESLEKLENLAAAFEEGKLTESEYRTQTLAAYSNRRRLLFNVARVSANGDSALAEAVLHCFDEVGDEGNITLAEVTGPSHYDVEIINGYPIPIGMEDSLLSHQQQYINDRENNRCLLERPVFLLYDGRVTEIQQVGPFLERLAGAAAGGTYPHNNVVLVANGFSDSVLAILGANFQEATNLKVFPLMTPQTIMPQSQQEFLHDLQAVVGAKIFDPYDQTLDLASPDFIDLGPGVDSFESTRWRSNVLGQADEAQRIERVDLLAKQMQKAESELERQFLAERKARLAGGLARLKVVGASGGEQKEKRDRAEDAVCAVRGALSRGCLPGGGWGLLRVRQELLNDPGYGKNDIIVEVLAPALMEPVIRILSNAGIQAEERKAVLAPVLDAIEHPKIVEGSAPVYVPRVYDAMEQQHVNAIASGILDSTPAVVEAIRNSLSIATLLGTLGGAVVFPRDREVDRQEAIETQNFLRNAGKNEADERA